ncbi:hypothetical protein [Halolamina sediminis]|uniref:hypothetical protein n=1 Tax=Halolamina sediminis TaxID=1480675 RepID=UPI0006B5E967|nr:hypothetical protein [Halolamina sediminis]
MSFSTSRSVGRGIRNSLSRSGVAVFVPVLLAQAAVLIAFNTVLQSTLQEELHGLSIGLAAIVALGVVNAGIGLLSLIDLAAAQVVSLVVISAFNVVSITVVGDAFRQLRGGASP